jgi:membrane-associated phospholipid phosphatase
MNFLQALDDRLYILINSLTGHWALLDAFAGLPGQSNLVKAGPVGAALMFAWFSRQPSDLERRRSILLVTLISLGLIVAITKTMGQSIFIPRPLVRSLPMLELEGQKFVPAAPLASREPLTGGDRERFEALQEGSVTANDLSAFPSDHAAFFFPLALGILIACRRAGIFAMAWTVVVILLTRVMSGMHSPIDVVAGAGIGTAVLLIMMFVARRWLTRLIDSVVAWTMRNEGWAAALLFPIAYAVVNVLDDLKAIGNAFLPLIKGLW